MKLPFIFRFKNKAMHISGLLKDRRQSPLQETCDWIEYVLGHGGARHLRAQVFNIPWYQYYLLDVVAFLVAIVIMVVMVMLLACRCLCRVLCKKGDVKTKKEYSRWFARCLKTYVYFKVYVIRKTVNKD